MLPSAILGGEAFPRTDDLFDSSSPGGWATLLVLVLRVDGIDTTLRGDVHLDLEEAATEVTNRCVSVGADSGGGNCLGQDISLTHLAMRRGGAWLGRAVLIGWTRLVIPAGAGHLGDRLANTVDGVQPRRSKRPNERATRVRDKPPTPPGLASPSASPSACLRSGPGVLSMATLIGEGQAGV